MINLPAPEYYVPFADGRYTVTARLRALGEDPHFRLDDRYLTYLSEKAAIRRRARADYYLQDRFSSGLHRAIAAFALDTLPRQLPQAFERSQKGGHAVLHNHLLGLKLTFDLACLQVVAAERVTPGLPGAAGVFSDIEFEGMDAFEALALQTQEDWVAVARDQSQDSDWTAALHVYFPSHWRPRDKIGRSFVDVHRPVAGIEPLLKAAPAMVASMIDRGPWERFTWTLPLDDHLDHHLDRHYPDPCRAEDVQPAEVGDLATVRIERQVIQGFPAEEGALFMIRIYLDPLARVGADPASRQALAAAVRSMTPASLDYKALTPWRESLLKYLDD